MVSSIFINMCTYVTERQARWTHKAETETGPFNSPKSKPEDPVNHNQTEMGHSLKHS